MSEKLYREIADQLGEEAGVISGQMFGKPCLKIGKKAFAVFYQDEMVFKLGRDEIADLMQKYPGAVNFDPSGKGRAMKDWLQLPFEFKDDWPALARQAMEYVEATK